MRELDKEIVSLEMFCFCAKDMIKEFKIVMPKEYKALKGKKVLYGLNGNNEIMEAFPGVYYNFYLKKIDISTIDDSVTIFPVLTTYNTNFDKFATELIVDGKNMSHLLKSVAWETIGLGSKDFEEFWKDIHK